MADLQAALSEAVKLNRSISQFLKFSTYTDYDDLSGLDMDRTDGEQLLLWEELRRITDKLADVEEYISYLTRPITEVSRLRKGTAGKYRTAKGRYYDCCSSIEALVTDEYHNVPYWTRTTVEHNGEDYYINANFPRDFTHAALLIAECLADYYRTGELIVTEYVGEGYTPVDHHIKNFVVSEGDLKTLLDELRKVQNPEHELYQSWFKDETRQAWLAHIQSLQQTLQEAGQRKPSITNQLKRAVKQAKESSVLPKAPFNHDSR